MSVLWGEKVWRSPDDAIRDATARFIHGARAIDYEQPRVDGTSSAPGIVLAAQTQVLAILQHFTEERQMILKAFAHGFGYAEIARFIRKSESTVRRWHLADRDLLQDRLIARGLLRGSYGP